MTLRREGVRAMTLFFSINFELSLSLWTMHVAHAVYDAEE